MPFAGSSATKIFDRLFDKATSPLLLEVDWETVLQLCDIVKSKEVQPKYVVQAVKKKFGYDSSNVIFASLQCLESFMKNCGSSFHKEVAQREMMEALRELAKTKPGPICEKVLELIQCWSHGLGQVHKILAETYALMKLENYRFPPLKESEAMFENSDIAPEWRDDVQCFSCRQLFTTLTRKHHCRACGDIFCDKCSSKRCAIPKYGIAEEVRVCISCYDKLTSGIPIAANSVSKPSSVTLNNNLSTASSATSNPTKSQAEIDEEESFQLALAISQSEAEEKERQKKMLTQKYATSSFLSSAPTVEPQSQQPVVEPTSNSDYAELKKYIERGQYQQEQFKTNPISNGHTADNVQPNMIPAIDIQQNFITDQEIDLFSSSVTDHIKNFKFRMLSNQQRSRNITNDTAVQSVFVILQHSHPELHRLMQLLEDKRAYFENLQDKLTQLKDAREALNALRAEHYQRKQQEAMERERQRQIQLAQKLDFMRQKKQEYLEYQRHLHLQRLAQQEQEMKTRLEQQRQMTLAREQYAQNPGMPAIPNEYNQIPVMNSPYTSPYGMVPMQGYPNGNSQYSSMMMYPSSAVPPTMQMAPMGNYQMSMVPSAVMPDNAFPPSNVSLPTSTGNMNYSQLPPQPAMPIASTTVSNAEVPEQQLISFD